MKRTRDHALKVDLLTYPLRDMTTAKFVIFKPCWRLRNTDALTYYYGGYCVFKIKRDSKDFIQSGLLVLNVQVVLCLSAALQFSIRRRCLVKRASRQNCFATLRSANNCFTVNPWGCGNTNRIHICRQQLVEALHRTCVQISCQRVPVA